MLSVGRYQLLETLGEGGMGVVYKAFDPLIRRTVAVKLIAARLIESPELRERFFAEARAAGQLAHRNIVTIFDLGEDNGHPYFAMEYLEGRNLRVRLQSFERMSLSRKLEVMAHVCEGLAYAHAKGVTHRDVKPANIFITDAGEVKVLDFGLARLPASELTHSKTLIGTLNYMAPEQIAGEKIDQRTDVFAVGVVFYEMLSGRSPFEADSVAALLNKILREEPQPVASLEPATSPALNALVARAMAKAREDRYQNLNELLIDLAECRTAIRDSDAGFVARLDLDVTREVPSSSSRPSAGSGSRPRSGSAGLHVPLQAGVDSGTGRALPGTASRSGTNDSPGSQGGPAAHGKWSRRTVPILAVAATAVVVVVVAGASGWWAHRQASPTEPSRPSATAAAPSSTGTAGTATDMPVPPAAPAAVQPDESRRAQRGDEAPGMTVRPRATDPVPRRTAPRPAPGTAPFDAAAANAEARSEAEAALAASRVALRDADASNARDLAPSTYRSASESEAAALELFERFDHARAAAKANEARSLFLRAEAEARAELARRNEQQRAASAPRPPDPPPAQSWPIAPPDPVPAPSAAPASPTGASSEAGIRDLLARYVDALEARDLAAVKQIWPALSGGQERALRNEFEHARSIDVDLGNLTFEITDSTATVVCRRRYSLVTLDGHHLESRNTSIFSVRRQNGAWLIDSVRHDAAR